MGFLLHLRLLFVLLLLSVLSSGQASDNDASNAQVEGSVSSATDGQLLPRSRVTLRRVAPKDSYLTVVNADDYGHFLFNAVDPGSYEVLAEKQGFFTDTRQGLNPTLEIKAGEHVASIVIRLIPLAAVTGQIVDEHDDPVQDAQVRLLSREYSHGRESLNPSGFAATDDRGEYRIFGVHPGKYYLVVEYDLKKARPGLFPGLPVKDGPPQIAYSPVFYPFTSDLRQAQRIVVAPGAELHFDFAFSSAPSVSLEGKVVNGITGEPAKNPSVVAYWGDKLTGITRKVDLSKNGGFIVDGIEPGPYTLAASISQNGETYWDLQVVDVGVSGLKNVELALMPDFAVAGQVRFADAQDSTPQRLSVEFVPQDPVGGAMRVSTDPAKRVPGTPRPSTLPFSARLHPGSVYNISIPSLPDDYYLKSVLIDGHEVSPSAVTIHGNNAEVVLVISSAGGHVEGLVRDSTGRPTAAHVLLTSDVDPLTPEQVRSVRTDANGKFTVRGLTPGNYKLYAWERLDLNELLGQLDLLKEFEADSLALHVDASGSYSPELSLISQRLRF